MSWPRWRCASKMSAPAGSSRRSSSSHSSISSLRAHDRFVHGSESRHLRSRAVPDVLIYADTIRSPELRHEVPIAIPDPFLYVERDGERHVVLTSFEIDRVRAIAGRSGAARVRGVRLRRPDRAGAAARGGLHPRSRSTRARRSASTRGVVPGDVPGRVRRPAPRGGRRARAGARRSSTGAGGSRARPSWPGSGARSARPRPGWTRRATCCGGATSRTAPASSSTASR